MHGSKPRLTSSGLPQQIASCEALGFGSRFLTCAWSSQYMLTPTNSVSLLLGSREMFSTICMLTAPSSTEGSSLAAASPSCCMSI